MLTYSKHLIELIKKHWIKDKKDFVLNVSQIHDVIKKKALINYDNDQKIKDNVDYPFWLYWKWIFDFRKLFLVNTILSDLSNIFWDMYENQYPFQVATIEFWGIPFLMGILNEWLKRWKNVNGLILRKERKTRWLLENIEWTININEKVIFVDDLINSWASIAYAIEVLKDKGISIHEIFCFVDFKNIRPDNLDIFWDINFNYLFELNDFGLDLNLPERNLWKNLNLHKKLIYEGKTPNISLNVPKSSPLFDENNIYLWWEDGLIVCIDKSWNLIWEHKIVSNSTKKNILSSPILKDNNIIIWGYDWNLYVLDKSNWLLKSINMDADWIGSSAFASTKDNIVYVWMEHYGTKWGSLAAIDIDTWRTIWQQYVDKYIHCSPLYIQDYDWVIIWTNWWELLFCDAKTWNIKRKLNFKWAIKHSFAYQNWVAYFGCFDNNIYAIDVATWNIKRNYSTWDKVYSRPIVYWEDIFVWCFDKKMYHLDTNWKLKNLVITDWKIISIPIIIEDKYLVFWSNDCRIYFYNISNQVVDYYIQHNEKITTKLYYEKGQLFYYDFTNKLWQILLPSRIFWSQK